MNDLQRFVETSYNRIVAEKLHGVSLRCPNGFARGIDVLGDDLRPAIIRSVKVYFKHHQRLPNLLNPGSFSEKQLLFKFFAPIPLHSPSNKLFARDYLPEARELGVKVPRVIWRSGLPKLPDNASLPPGRYWLKSNHSSGKNRPVVFPLDDSARQSLEKLTTNWLTSIHDRRKALWWYEIFVREIYMEEDLAIAGPSANDWKFFVCNGRVALFQHDRDRLVAHDQTIYDPSGNHLPETLYYPGNQVVEPPKQLDVMTKAAEAIGSSFDFIRVDFFIKDDSVYLGEIALVPNGCSIPIRSAVINHLLGQVWKAPWMGSAGSVSLEGYNDLLPSQLHDGDSPYLNDENDIWEEKKVASPS